MQTFPFIKSISTVLIVGLALLDVGCYTYHTAPIHPEELPSSETIVITTDRKYCRLADWAIDDNGNLAGIGVAYPSKQEFNDADKGTPFEDTLPYRTCGFVEVDEVDFSIKTSDGKYYRIASWALKSNGNLVGRESVYSSREEAENNVSPTSFQGVIDAVTLHLSRWSR